MHSKKRVYRVTLSPIVHESAYPTLHSQRHYFIHIYKYFCQSDGQKWINWCGFNCIMSMIFGPFIGHLYLFFPDWFLYILNSFLYQYNETLSIYWMWLISRLQIFFPSHHILIYGVYRQCFSLRLLRLCRDWESLFHPSTVSKISTIFPILFVV